MHGSMNVKFVYAKQAKEIYCVDCSKSDASSTFAATFIFTATLKNEEAKFFFEI